MKIRWFYSCASSSGDHGGGGVVSLRLEGRLEVSNLPCAKNFEIHTLHRNYESQGESNPYLVAMWRMQTVYPYPSLDHRVVILCEKIMLPLSLIIHFLMQWKVDVHRVTSPRVGTFTWLAFRRKGEEEKSQLFFGKLSIFLQVQVHNQAMGIQPHC